MPVDMTIEEVPGDSWHVKDDDTKTLETLNEARKLMDKAGEKGLGFILITQERDGGNGVEFVGDVSVPEVAVALEVLLDVMQKAVNKDAST